MSSPESHWPIYATTGEALNAETAAWGDRLDDAQHRYELLDGELPHRLAKVTIGIVEGLTESPDQFSLVSLYGQQDFDPELSGVLLYVNYEGTKPPDNAYYLAEVMREQRERAGVPTAIAFVGYDEKRRIDRVRANAWDVVVAHALQSEITHPVIGISNDADTVDLSPGYSAGMTEHEHVVQPGKVWGSEVAFSQPGGSDLPLHKVFAHLI